MTNRLMSRPLAFVGLIGLALAGCAETQPPSFYLLSSLPPPETSNGSMVSDQPAIGVGPVTLPVHLDRPQLVTRANPNRLDLAEFDRWAEPLQGMFSRTLAENISALVKTDLVYVLPRRNVPELDYQVAVEVFRFDRGADGQVQLLARWTIFTDRQSETLLTRRSLITESTPPESGPEEIIVGLSHAVETLAREISGDLQTLADRSPDSSYDVSEIQNALQSKGYDPGPADGEVGRKTRDAIRQFQADQGAEVTGEPSRHLQNMLTETQ